MNQIDILKNVLKNEGLRYTQQRQIIWDEIRSSTEHRDAEEIYPARCAELQCYCQCLWEGCAVVEGLDVTSGDALKASAGHHS